MPKYIRNSIPRDEVVGRTVKGYMILKDRSIWAKCGAFFVQLPRNYRDNAR